jgi:APA family basic amino acid/polyamine antiporter
LSLLDNLVQRKSLDALVAETTEPGHTLKRALGPWNIVALGVGAIIGAGIFATIGTAAAGDASRPGAGPALTISFILTAVVCGFTALCYAEFASMVPVAGSAYTYAYATLGELFAWIIGWDLILEYAIGAATVANGWSGYFQSVIAKFGLHFPEALAGPPIVYKTG